MRNIRCGLYTPNTSFRICECTHMYLCNICGKNVFNKNENRVYVIRQPFLYTESAHPKDAAYVKRKKNTVKFCVNMNNLINCFSSHEEKNTRDDDEYLR